METKKDCPSCGAKESLSPNCFECGESVDYANEDVECDVCEGKPSSCGTFRCDVCHDELVID